MSFAALLDNKVDIKSRTKGGDTMGGGGTITYADVYLNVPFRFESLDKKEELLAYDKKTTYPDYYGYCEYKANIKEAQVVIFDSRYFEIKLVQDWSEQGKYMRLSLTEITRNE